MARRHARSFDRRSHRSIIEARRARAQLGDVAGRAAGVRLAAACGMEKINKRKLALRTETIRRLSTTELEGIDGGLAQADNTMQAACDTRHPPCCCAPSDSRPH
jgi:hypothetical protein